MENKENCKIIKDLLPSYIDELTSEETKKYNRKLKLLIVLLVLIILILFCGTFLRNAILITTLSDKTEKYKFCNNYREGDCAGCGGPCIVESLPDDKRAVKGQCPNPSLYHYLNVFDTYGLIRASFFMNQPFSLDDLSKTEPVLRSVFQVTTGYYVDHVIGGRISTDLGLNTTLI